MQYWTSLDQVPRGYGPSVVTLGNFDGVHRGHQQIIKTLVGWARSTGGNAVAVTFWPHPAQVHRPETAPQLITGLEDRLELLAGLGLDAALVLPYSEEFARSSAEQFVIDYLVRPLATATIVVGRDVRFGHQNEGNLQTMISLGGRYGFEVAVVDDAGDHGLGSAARRWSSTWVRELLDAGKVDQVTSVLGRRHRLRGSIVGGDARGRDLGFPTANIGPDLAGFVPADGIYAGYLEVVSQRRDGFEVEITEGAHPQTKLPAAISIGTNPTFGGTERRVEAYVLDRTDLNLYDKQVVLEFAKFLRPTEAFDSSDELITQMHADVAQARSVLAADNQ